VSFLSRKSIHCYFSLTMNPDTPTPAGQILRDNLGSDPNDWESRRRLAHALYDQNAFEEAADLIWDAPEIPSTDIDLAFASRILAKGRPRRAIRLLTAVLEQNRGKAVQNLGMANALLHHGMVLQAARFYGAALEADPSLANPDLEHFVLWTDDEQTLWGDFKNRRPALGDLPWMMRDSQEAQQLNAQPSHHTTPIYVPKLPSTPAEQLKHEIYQQEMKRNAAITPPPAVTIPIDRVDPKDRRFDPAYGAEISGQEPPAMPVETASPPPATAPTPMPLQPATARRLLHAAPTRLTPSPDAPPRKTTVMPIQFPPPITAIQTVKAAQETAKIAAWAAGVPNQEPPKVAPVAIQLPEEPEKPATLPPLPPVDPAAPTRRRLVIPGITDAARPGSGA